MVRLSPIIISRPLGMFKSILLVIQYNENAEYYIKAQDLDI